MQTQIYTFLGENGNWQISGARTLLSPSGGQERKTRASHRTDVRDCIRQPRSIRSLLIVSSVGSRDIGVYIYIHIRAAAARVSKMALTAVAGYHIGHLVDLASLLSPSRTAWSFRTFLHLRAHVYAPSQSHSRHPLLPSYTFSSTLRQKRFRLSLISREKRLADRDLVYFAKPVRIELPGEHTAPWEGLAH